MKPLQGYSVNNNSCTCSSCDSKSESDRQTLKRLLNQGSKINKLLTGKYYVHLRESDLLDKLIKTRALYESLRSQLLSSSGSTSADLQSQQSSREIRKDFVEAEKSSDIFTLVDQVDKGAVMGLRKLSECCSCCTCSSKFRLNENVQKGRRNRQAGGIIASRSSLVSKQEADEAKNIKSDPYTCACFQKEKNMKSKELVEKVRPRKSIIERDYLPATSSNLKLTSINNRKLERRKSYHELKRVKACPSPYMENIGENINKALRKSKLVTHTIARTISIELLEAAQKKRKDNFETDRKALRKKEPVESSMIKENMSRANNTTTIKLKDKFYGKRQAQSSKLKQSFAHKSRKNNRALTDDTNISESLKTSSTSTLKEIPFIKGHERKERCPQRERCNKMYTLAETNTEISDKLPVYEESHALKESNQVQYSKTSQFPPQKDTADVVEKNKKLPPFTSIPGKELNIPNTATMPDIQNPESIASVKKSHSTSHKKISNLKTRSFVSFRKRLILLSGPLRFRPRLQISGEPRQEPARHKKPRHSEELCPYEQCLEEAPRLLEEPGRRKKPSEDEQKNKKSGSHGLKRCLCSIKFKINETKFRISKNVTNENLKVKDKLIIHPKSLLSSEKTLKIASNDDPKHMPDHAIKCESSDYVKQSQAIRKNKQAAQNETNAPFVIKCIDEIQLIQRNHAQDISTTTQLSIDALISGCVCKEVEKFMYKHYGQQNIKFEEKSTFNHNLSNKPKEKSKMQDEHAVINYLNRIASKCECFDENIVSEERRRSKDQGKSNTRLRIKSTLKDASITTEKLRKLQNQSVQAVMKLKQQEKNACNPRFSIKLNKGYFNNGFKITQGKVKYKCHEGTKQLPNKQCHKKLKTTIVHGLRRCLCTLQLEKQENKIKNQRKLSKLTMIQPRTQVKGYQTELNLARHVILPYEYDLNFSSPTKCFSQQLEVKMNKREERKFKKHNTPSVRNSRSNSSHNSRSLQIPKTENIHSIVISHNSEMLSTILKRNKIKSPDICMHRVRPKFLRKIHNSKRPSCLCSQSDKDNKIKEDTIICSLKDNKVKNAMKSLQKILLHKNTTKEDQTLLLELTNKRSLPTLKLRMEGEYNNKSSLVNTDIKSNIIIIADKIRGFKKCAKFTKSKYSNQLSKCKKCNPDEYLEKNKRNKTLKQFGILTKKNKLKSKSRDIHSLRTKLFFVRSHFQQQNPSLQIFKKMRINSESSYLSQLNEKKMKQGIDIGSNFSFDINFYKGVTAKNIFYQNGTKNMKFHFLNNTQLSNLPTKRYSSNRITHLSTRKVSPAPNKCFCKLKISKMNEQRRNSKMLSPIATKKLTQVYAMSTVAMAMPENKLKTPVKLKGDHDCRCVDSYHPLRYSNASSVTKQWQFSNKNPTCGFSLSMIAFNAKNIQSCIRESKYKLLQINSTEQNFIDFASNEAIRFESAFSCEMDYLKNICKKKRNIGSAQSQNDLPLHSQHNPSLLTGAQPLLRRCYCTMNIQVARQKRKLLDYECEPGICIPGECDPYECQKLIMKRLMRKVSRMSGTDSRSRNSASGTSSTSSRSKRLQSSVAPEPKYHTRGHGARLKPARPSQGLKYQTLPRGSAPARRQAVKVSSTFSFNIEFSKGITKSSAAPTTETVIKVPKRHTFSRSSTTYHKRGMDRGTKYSGGRHQRETQPMMKQMRHRASSVTPVLKRCFCTLKLQKKGRHQKDFELRTITQGTSTPPKLGDDGPVFRTSEKGQNTKRKHKFDKEKELIKKRNKHTKEFGTDSMVSSTSSSIMTSSQKRKMKRIQARNIRPKQFRSSYTSIRSQPSAMSIDTGRRRARGRRRDYASRESVPQEKVVIPMPSQRQAVRIGSNFSFNIEFYKDKSPNNLEVQGAAPIVKRYRPLSMRDRGHHTYRRVITRDRGLRRRRFPSTSRESQVDRIKNRDIGLGPILRRCFCTLKLKKKSKAKFKAVSKAETETKMAKSKSKSKAVSKTDIKPETETKTIQKKTDIQTQKNTIPNIKCLCDRSNKKNECTCTPSIKEVATLHNKSIATLKKMKESIVAPEEMKENIAVAIKPKRNMKRLKTFPYKLKSYECEPGICVPGECDPWECLKLINKRLMYSSGTSTVQRGTRSTSNMAVSTYRDSGAQSYMPRKIQICTRDTCTRFRPAWPKTKMTQLSSARRRVRGRRRDYALSDSILQEKIVSPSSPQRQAVRIGSNFSFSVEFYKDKSANNLEVQVAAPVVERYQPVSKRDRGHGAYHRVRTRDRGHGAYHRVRTRDRGLRGRRFPSLSRYSQMDRVKSRDIGLGPMLRRCFCTLKLKKKTKAQSKAAIKAETETKTIQKGTAGQTQKNTISNRTCLCDKANKKKCICDQPNKKNECTCTPSIKEIATLHNKSITTVKKTKEGIVAQEDMKESIVASKKTKESIVVAIKPKRKRRKAFPDNLEPYECEPGICVPGECDPWECLKRINKRLMYSSGTSTDQRGTRSTSNMTVSTYRDCEAQCYMDRKKQMRTRNNYTRYIEKIPYAETRSHREKWPPRESRLHRERRPHRERRQEFRTSVVKEPTKQAVKIGSNFNFEMEFSKSKLHSGSVVTSKPIKQYSKPKNTSSRATGLSTYYRTKKVQRYRSNRDIHSQALGPSMRSAMTGTVGPFLKRCFCTLQLRCNTENHLSPFKCVSNLKPRWSKSPEKSQAIQFTICGAATNKQAFKKLLPGECEPGFCVPGEYDPYECMKRRMQSKQVGTIFSTRSFSSSTGEGRNYKSRYIQNRSSTARRRNVMTSRCSDQCQDAASIQSISSSSDERKYRPRRNARSFFPTRRKVKAGMRNDDQLHTSCYRQAVTPACILYDIKPKRQAVRVGSNFSLDIEFFKENSSKLTRGPQVNNERCCRRGRVERSISTNNRSSDERNYLGKKRVKRGTMTRSISTKSISSYGKKYNPREVKSQLEVKTTYSKGIGTPLFKRCYCTLKFEKKGRLRQPKSIIKACRKASSFKSPCEKSELSTTCVSTHTNLKTKLVYLLKRLASRETRDRPPNGKCCKCNTPMLEPSMLPCQTGKKCKCNTCFRITNKYQYKKSELYKSRVGNTEQKMNPMDNCKCKKPVVNCKCKKPVVNCKCKTPEDNCKCKTQKPDKNKNCQCTTQNLEPFTYKTSTVKLSDKTTSTKKKYDPSKHLDLRGIPRMNQSPNKRMKRHQRMSVSSMAATFVPGYTHKRIKYKGGPYYPDKIERIVEEPRYPFLQGKDARQGVNISSNFSFNVEFFKEFLPPAMDTQNEGRKSPSSHRKDRKKKSSIYGPKEYLIEYQIQQPTRKYFKSNPQELGTIMSYAASKSDNNFGRMDPTKQGPQGIPKYMEAKKSILKNMLIYCKTLIIKRSNKHNNKKLEGWTELKKEATNKPIRDILKASNSERHPNKVTTANIKKSKSLKVAKISDNNDYKKKYSRYQSGDHHGSKSQYTGIKFVKTNCKHCQNMFKHTIPIHDMVRYTTLRTAKTINSQPNDAIVTERKKYPVAFMFKSPKLKNSCAVHINVCSCCGGIQRIEKKTSDSNFLNIKDKILVCSEDITTSIMPKGSIAIPIYTPEEETALLPQENKERNKQDCQCCLCKTITKSKTLEDKKKFSSVYTNAVWKNEPERRAENMYHGESIKTRDNYVSRTTICPAKSETKAIATGSGYKLDPDKKETYTKPVQETKLKEVIDKNINEKDESKNLAKYKNTPGALLVKSVLDSKVELTSTVEILRNLHIKVSDPKSAFGKFQSYLCDRIMHACKKFQRAAYNGLGVETLQRLKLKFQARKYVTENKEKFEDHLEPNFAIHSKTNRKKKTF